MHQRAAVKTDDSELTEFENKITWTADAASRIKSVSVGGSGAGDGVG